mgnify:CR=1 FL=1
MPAIINPLKQLNTKEISQDLSKTQKDGIDKLVSILNDPSVTPKDHEISQNQKIM